MYFIFYLASIYNVEKFLLDSIDLLNDMNLLLNSNNYEQALRLISTAERNLHRILSLDRIQSPKAEFYLLYLKCIKIFVQVFYILIL
jgi:hypothetical protein